jgi:hypothetical protein
MGRLRFSNADGIVSNAGVIAPLPTTAVGPLLASGGPSLVACLGLGPLPFRHGSRGARRGSWP